MPKLELWEYDGTIFTGYLYGHKHFDDGQLFSTGVNFVDWKAKRIIVGEEMIELGGSREELNETEEDDIPW